ncbi:hypothetical protein KJ656_03885 [bacterium]|nr:hypothetical protein [bacterium]
MAQSTLRDLALAYENISEEVMSHLTKKSGILQTAEVKKATHNTLHKYKKVTALPTFSVREIGGSITPQAVNKEIYQSDLKIVTARQEEDKAFCDNYPGGPEAYFSDNFLSFIEAWGQKAATMIIYGTNSTFGEVQGVHGLHQIANANSKVIHETGTSALTTTIFCVKWDPLSISLLYNAELAAAGDFLKTTILHDGRPVMSTTNVTTRAAQPVYEVLYESYLGLFSASAYDVAKYDRIEDATGDEPTSDNMDILGDHVKAEAGNSYYYCNRTARRLLWRLKNTKMATAPATKDYNNVLETWNGIPLVLDENILDTESTALD